MKKTEFILNGKNLVLPDFTFNTIIELEDMGIALSDLGASTMKFIRAFIAIALDVDQKEAGLAIENFIIDGGDLAALFEVVSEGITESGFIKALTSSVE